MNYLLDTNVVSETTRKSPHPGVSKFLHEIAPESLYLSVLTIGEIRKGLEQTQDLQKKQSLILWMENDLLKFFGNRILPVNLQISDKWGFLTSKIKSPVPAIDSLLAATALNHNLVLVTRNIKDFAQFQVEVLNPWETI